MRMLFAAAAALAAACVPAAAAGGKVYHDTKSGFEILQPDGWTKSTDPLKRDQRVVFRGPQYDKTGESCGVIAADVPATSSLTQAQIDADVKSGNELKLETAQIKQQIPTAVLLSQSIVTIDGHPAQQYAMSVPFPLPTGGTLVEVIRNVGLSRPGVGYAIDCMTRKNNFDGLHTEFDPIIMSFKATKHASK